MISMNRNDNKVNAKSLKVNAVVNMAKTVLSLVFPLITFPYVSRVLGVNQMGKYNFANSVISYFLLIAALGISTYAIREGTQYRNNQKAIDEFASEMFSINLVSTVVAYVDSSGIPVGEKCHFSQ
jgi:O-antigen/teichoic acid export membrane protein